MPAAMWPLLHDRPIIQVHLSPRTGGVWTAQNLLADTGAGSRRTAFELLLDEEDCVQAGSIPLRFSSLGGAYSGSFLVYLVRISIPLLGFEHDIPAVAVPNPPAGFDGIACFRLLNRFQYGNFGDPNRFGLETQSNS